MSGHSKWSTIKRAKSVKDSKKGAIFTKLGNIITIATRDNGEDIDANFSLRMAIEKAKSANMPKENIDRAIKRGMGILVDKQVEELIYEGIGPANSQFVVKCLTDNKNRSVSNVRHIFSKFGGFFRVVMWNFDKKGVIRINNLENEELELELIDVGVQDILREEEVIIIYTKIEFLNKIKKLLEEKGIVIESIDIKYIAKEKIELNNEDNEKIEEFITELEYCEDVSSYYTNIVKRE